MSGTEPSRPTGDPDENLVWVAVPRRVLTGAPAPGAADAATDSQTALLRGRLSGYHSDHSRIELRVDQATISGDIFLRVNAEEIWVASFRSVPNGAPGAGQEIAVTAQDRLRAVATGQLLLEPNGAEYVLTLTFEGKLDGLPVLTPIRALMQHVGAAPRHLNLEVLSEISVPALPVLDRNGCEMGLIDALTDAAFEVTSLEGRVDLPEAPEGGWSEKQLHTLMNDFARSDLVRPGFAIRLLWLSRSNRENLQGVMFDTGDDLPRQGAAVFASAITDTTAPALADRKLLQTAIHEIGHVLNLTHRFDRQVGRADSLSFMNYDWQYAGGSSAFWRKFNYCFDDDELSFLHHGHYHSLVPGGDVFGSAHYWSGLAMGYSPILPEMRLPGWRLELLPPVSGPTFQLGQPVLLGLLLTNETGAESLLPRDVLDPKAGSLEVWISRESGTRDDPAAAFRPVTHRCVHQSAGEPLKLADGAALEDNLNLTYGLSGFPFSEPGTYRITAYLHLGTEHAGSIARSEVLRIRVMSPESKVEDRAALTLFEPTAGACIALGGSAAYETAVSDLMETAARLTGRKKAPHPVSVGIWRALGFHFDRQYLRFDRGRFYEAAPQEKEAEICRRQLTSETLDCLDPVTRQATLKWTAQVREASKDYGQDP
ncbi:hypothetical protein SAMN04488021_1502 [Paracoccus aminovorans]|uniref:Metallo-peptidase family M12B Reprolysin-like n=1 Tax=Paracoccus aminovorans TaxID=34004 RepID=A0A1I3EKU5_9RHOB|nr:hypothetical protein [Paracoccus aminovorans]CQR87585.1 hypothetical protein JCM7685_3045 [Paracoccus aminovorans]SFH99493.1 hypothetical protein SAMN04488021_1502 [Paracoccus aminovorans]